MTTSEVTLQDYLNARKPTDGQILIALRYYLSELTDDMLPTEMLNEMSERAGDRDAVEAARDAFAKDQGSQVSAALMLFSSKWDDPEERSRIQSAFDAVATRLPVVEAALIAIVGMYAMYLATTGGAKSMTKTFRKNPDGSYERTSTTELYGPMAPISAVVSLFTGAKVKNDDED